MFQIMVVDDDKNIRMLLKAVLEAENYSVITAENPPCATMNIEVTPRMVNELIERIEVHQSEKIDGEWVQTLTIYYNCVGALFIPDTETLPVPDVTVNTRRGVFVTYEPAQNQ